MNFEHLSFLFERCESGGNSKLDVKSIEPVDVALEKSK